MHSSKSIDFLPSRWLGVVRKFIFNFRAGFLDIGLLLLIGFGAMLALIVVSGLDAIRTTERLRTREALSLTRYSEQERILSDIQMDLLWGSIWAGDFLQTRNRAPEEFSRYQLWGLRQQWNMARAREEKLPLAAEQQKIWNDLDGQIEAFWSSIDPILEWTAVEKSARAGRFLRQYVLPQRASIMALTDQLGALDRHVLEAESADIRRSAQRFRRTMLLRIAVFALLGGAVTYWTMRYARRLQRKLQRQNAEIIADKINLQRLSAKIVHAQEDERRAISRELHDQIGQALTAIKVNLGITDQKLATAPPELRERIRESKLLADQTIQEVRDLARLLRPSMLDDLGLVPALEWYVRSFSRRFSIPVHLTIDAKLGRMPDDWETCIFRSVQEALTNTIRHSSATEVGIRIEQNGSGITLSVEDNGGGFELSTQAGGLGLIGMTERARELGGTLFVESKDNQGTRIRMTLPQPQTAPAPEVGV